MNTPIPNVVSQPIDPIRASAWGLLLILTLLNVLNFADRYLIIAFAGPIIRELGLTHLQFGLLTGVVFTLVYTLIGLLFGSLADRVNRVRLIAISLALWSALTAATGLTRSFVQMASARMCVGIGEAGLTPAGLSILTQVFAPARHALVNGAYYLGIPVGIGSSFILAGILGPRLGWRGSFIALGVVGIVAAALIAWLMREPGRIAETAATKQARESGSFSASLRGIGYELVNNPAFVLTLLGCIAATIMQGAAVLDLVWWARERGYAEATAQQLNGALFLAGGVFGSIFGSLAADWAHRRFGAGRLKFLGFIFMIGVPLMLAFRLVPGQSPLFLVLAFFSHASFLLVYGPSLATIQELLPVAHRASGVALFILSTSLIGAGGGAACVGWLADVYGAAQLAEPLTRAIVSTQCIGLLAIPAFLFAARSQLRRQRLLAEGI
jgi:MFS transporter, Spinster family, sphingosine-1-phosphate transporter